MTLAPRLLVALLAVVLAWSSTPETLRAEIFAYRDAGGVLHLSNVQDSPRWIPLHVPPSIRPHGFDATNLAYPFARIVNSYARQAGIEASLIRAIIKVESNFDPRAKSKKGAIGLMQVLPETAARYGRFDLYEPDDNIRVGIRHLKLLLAQFGNDLRLALAAYNAGAKVVEQYGGIPPFPETIQYISRVLHRYNSYRPSSAAFSWRGASHRNDAETR
jgi:soluble lytic murein transglycosylase-like protein